MLKPTIRNPFSKPLALSLDPLALGALAIEKSLGAMLQFVVDECLHRGGAVKFSEEGMEFLLEGFGTANGEEEAGGVGE